MKYLKNKTDAQTAGDFREGFTLVEMMVVVAIIILLVSITVPAVGRVQARAVQIQCANNLRTWGSAILLYATDHDGDIRWNNWASIGGQSRFYEEYLGEADGSSRYTVQGQSIMATQYHRRCPAQEWDGTGNGPVGYGFVRPKPHESSVHTFSLLRATNPSTTLVMSDATTLVMGGHGSLADHVAPLTYGDRTRHGRSFNALFLDGRVGTYRWTEIRDETELLEEWFRLH